MKTEGHFVSNYRQIYEAVRAAYPPPNPPLRNEFYVFPEFEGLSVKLCVSRHTHYFTMSPGFLNIDLSAERAVPSGWVQGSKEALPAFLDWLADLVGAERPTWEPTYRTRLEEEARAMPEEDLRKALKEPLRRIPEREALEKEWVSARMAAKRRSESAKRAAETRKRRAR